MTAEEDIAVKWLEVVKGYSIALKDKKLICKNSKGKILTSVPKAARDTEEAQQLLTVRDWLKEHEISCLSTVESWLLRSLPIGREVLSSIWKDSTWKNLIFNAVVVGLDKSGEPDFDECGFLRSIDDRGIGIVNLDGETEWIEATSILIPHPILIEDLEDCRELAAELDLQQGIQQLFRETFEVTDELKEKESVMEFDNGKFEALTHCTSLCRRLGYLVSGGYAVCKIWENGVPVEARFWIGADYPEEETYTGELVFVNEKDKTLKISEVGPVSFSEGMRMASAVYAKRVIEKKEEEQ